MDLKEFGHKMLGLLRERGFCKLQLEDEDGHLCIVGTLNMADHGDARCWRGHNEHKDIYGNLLTAVGCQMARRLNVAVEDTEIMQRKRREAVFPHDWFPDPLGSFNNDPETTFEDLVDLIVAAAGLDLPDVALPVFEVVSA